MKNSFKNWFKSKNIPDEIRVLKVLQKRPKGKDLTVLSRELGIEEEIILNLNIQKKYLKYKNINSYSITADGIFKLIEWENLQKTRRTAKLSIFIAAMSVIAAVAATFFSGSDKTWQKEQIELLQQQNQLLEKITFSKEI